MSPRSSGDSLNLDYTRVGPRQQKHVLDQGCHVPYLGLDVAQRFAHVLDLAAPVAFQILDACRDHGDRSSQLMTGVRGELALALQRLLAAIYGRSNGNEARPA